MHAAAVALLHGSGRIPNCHLQWQDSKLSLAMAGYQTVAQQRKMYTRGALQDLAGKNKVSIY
jgi:hypothetical protein